MFVLFSTPYIEDKGSPVPCSLLLKDIKTQRSTPRRLRRREDPHIK